MRKGNCRSRASSTGFRAASLICAVALTTSHCVTSSTAYLFALPRIACYQQLRRAGDPAHGDGAQNLGRQSNGDRRPHAADFGQRVTHLLAARQGCLWPVGEVTALCSTHLAGNRPHRTITLSGPATCSTPAPFDRRNHPRPPKPIQRDSRAYAEVCLARGKHSHWTALLLYFAGFHHWAYRKRAIRSLALNPGDTVVDLGCGTGLSFSLLQER